MPARRDYASAWRDAWAALLQIPVAGLLAQDYFYQQWVERSANYLSQVGTRLALARPLSAEAGRGNENVMADVLSEDLVAVTRDAVHELVTLPADAADYFYRHLGELMGEVVAQVQPDAATDARSYVINELEKLNAELYRLREVAGVDSRQSRGTPRGAAARGDTAALASLLHAVAAAVEEARREPAGADTPPRYERMLQVVQAVVGAAVKAFKPDAPVGPADGDGPLARVEQRLQDALERVRAAERRQRRDDVEDQAKSRPRARPQSARTRRYRKRTKR